METKAPITLTEVKGDLWTAKGCLAHCVSRDFAMGKGIAVTFRDRLGSVPELIAQRRSVGQVASLVMGPGRVAFYLITKERYFHKPTYETMQAALKDLASQMIALGLKELAIPQIGCGLDRLSWPIVKAMVQTTFAGTGIAVTVYTL